MLLLYADCTPIRAKVSQHSLNMAEDVSAVYLIRKPGRKLRECRQQQQNADLNGNEGHHAFVQGAGR